MEGLFVAADVVWAGAGAGLLGFVGFAGTPGVGGTLEAGGATEGAGLFEEDDDVEACGCGGALAARSANSGRLWRSVLLKGCWGSSLDARNTPTLAWTMGTYCFDRHLHNFFREGFVVQAVPQQIAEIP